MKKDFLVFALDDKWDKIHGRVIKKVQGKEAKGEKKLALLKQRRGHVSRKRPE